VKELHRRARLRLLRMHYESGFGHLGGNLSALDLPFSPCNHRVMGKDDLFVLSKDMRPARSMSPCGRWDRLPRKSYWSFTKITPGLWAIRRPMRSRISSLPPAASSRPGPVGRAGPWQATAG